MLSARDAFKVGFLERCAARGLGPGRIEALSKAAADKAAGIVADLAKGVGKGVGGLAGGAVGWGVPLALAAPPIAGATAGYALAKATDLDDTDLDDIKDNELIDEYRRQAARLDRQRVVRQYQQLKRRTGRVFG